MRREGSPTRRADGSSGNSTSRMLACVTRSRVPRAKRSVKLSARRYVHIVGYGRQVITKDWARYYGERQVVLGALRLDSRRSATRLLAGAARMRGTCDASHRRLGGLDSLTWNSTRTE